MTVRFCFKDKSPLPPFFKGGKRLVSQACSPLCKRGARGNASNLRLVVPAKAGTQFVKLLLNNQFEFLDSGLRRNDGHFLP